MLQLWEAFEGYSYFIITYKEESVSGQKNTYYLKNIARGPLAFLVGVVRILVILLKERPDIIFSTGSEIAITPFYFGKFLLRTKLIYLESGAQVYHPSGTGKFVYPITDLFLVQWEALLKRYGPKATYVGGLI